MKTSAKILITFVGLIVLCIVWKLSKDERKQSVKVLQRDLNNVAVADTNEIDSIFFASSHKLCLYKDEDLLTDEEYGELTHMLSEAYIENISKQINLLSPDKTEDENDDVAFRIIKSITTYKTKANNLCRLNPNLPRREAFARQRYKQAMSVQSRTTSNEFDSIFIADIKLDMALACSNSEKANQYTKAAEILSPDHVRINEVKSILELREAKDYMRKGLNDKAEQHLRAALALDPTNNAAKYLLEDMRMSSLYFSVRQPH